MDDEADDGRQACRVQTFDLIVRENVADDERVVFGWTFRRRLRPATGHPNVKDERSIRPEPTLTGRRLSGSSEFHFCHSDALNDNSDTVTPYGMNNIQGARCHRSRAQRTSDSGTRMPQPDH